MCDPLSLVGITVLTEGVKFLYTQAGEAIKWWRSRSPGAVSDPTTAPPSVLAPPGTFEGLDGSVVRFDGSAVMQLETDLRDLRRALGDYAQGIDPVDPSDQQLVETVNGLRLAMEAVCGQRLTFRGEQRDPASGLEVRGSVDVGDVRGYVAGLRARRLVGGSVSGSATADQVSKSGQLFGVDADTIGTD